MQLAAVQRESQPKPDQEHNLADDYLSGCHENGYIREWPVWERPDCLTRWREGTFVMQLVERTSTVEPSTEVFKPSISA